MKIKKELKLFLEWCEENRAPNTVRHYLSRLKSFREKFGKKKMCELQPLDIEAWLRIAGRKPNGEPMAPDTRRANAVAFLRFQAWSVEFGTLAAPILEKIEKPRGNLRERIPTAEETQAILDGGSEEFRRIFQALRHTGARPGELCKAQIEDWNRETDMVVLLEHKTARKTGKPRLIPVGKAVKPFFLEAVGDRETGPIFLSARGKQWTANGLSQNYRRIRDEAGLSKDLVLYLTRHEFASKVCKVKGIYITSKLLGHGTTQTTERYLKIDTQTLLENQEAFGD